MPAVNEAVLRQAGCMPAETFVEIWKCVARPNLCEPPPDAKPPTRYLSFWDSAAVKKMKSEIENYSEKSCSFAKK